MTNIVNSKDKERKFRRLADLSLYISKYSDLWGKSHRLFGWVDEYNLLRSSMSWELWQEYCGRMGYAPSHDGYDNLA